MFFRIHLKFLKKKQFFDFVTQNESCKDSVQKICQKRVLFILGLRFRKKQTLYQKSAMIRFLGYMYFKFLKKNLFFNF